MALPLVEIIRDTRGVKRPEFYNDNKHIII